MLKCLKINRLENEVKRHVQSRAQLDSFMHNLGVSDRDKTIMHMRLGLEGEKKMTLRAIAQKMERSSELIRQRKDKTSQKLLAHIRLMTEIANIVRDPTRLNYASVEILDLGARARNVLAIANVKTMEELLQKTPEFLLNYKRCGVKTIEEIQRKLATMNLTLKNGGAEITVARIRENPNLVPNASVKILELSTRVQNALAYIHIDTLGKLMRHTPESLLTFQRLGKKSVEEIQQKLADLGLTLNNVG